MKTKRRRITDKAMLDWLNKHLFDMWGGIKCWTTDGGYHGVLHRTIRDAIDAAMRTERRTR